MGRKSKVDKIPTEAREFLNGLLRDPANSQLDMTEKVNQQLVKLGLEPNISQSSVNRYVARMNKVGSKIIQTREAANVFMSKIGTEEAGNVGKLTSEILSVAVCELSTYLAEKDIQESKGDEHKLAKTLKDLAQAAKLAQESGEVVDKRIEKAIRKAKLEAAQEIAVECKKEGISEHAEQVIRGILLGRDDVEPSS